MGKDERFRADGPEDRIHPLAALLLMLGASGLLWALFLWFALLLAATR